MIWYLLAKLVTVHVLGDFVLQPDHWVASRQEKHFRSPYLYFHGLVHMLLVLLVAMDIYTWWIAVVIGMGHILLDGAKALLQKNGIWAFITDQLLHLLILTICFTIYSRTDWRLPLTGLINSQKFWWLAAGYLTVIFAYSRLIAFATLPWRKDIPADREILQKAGRLIGMIERTLVLTFVLLGQFGAIGFLMAAKSVFRFGDMREGKDKGHTEYVLIGTLLSFGLTIITGLLLDRIIRQ